MAFLDFIKNRQQPGQEASQQSKPEISQDNSRQVAQESVGAKSVENMRPDQQARLAEAQSLFRQGTQQANPSVATPAPAPEDATSSPQPMRQNSMRQDNPAPDLSPTSAQSGVPSREADGPSVPTDSSSKAQEQSPVRIENYRSPEGSEDFLKAAARWLA
jgi:hypothetical protein